MTTHHSIRAGAAATAVTAMIVLAACGNSANGSAGTASSSTDTVSGTVTTAGSSTVGPLTKNIGERFTSLNPGVTVNTQITSTGDGLKALCAGSLDIANASRRIEPDEKAACEKAGVKYTEILAANDGITVVVNPANSWATCLTTAQLKTMWAAAAKGTVSTWKQVDGAWPEEKLALYGPDMESGTLDYFTQKITGSEKSIRSDYSGSTDDHKTLEGVNAAKGGVGFLGLSYALDNEDLVKRVAVDGGKGCVEASPTSVRDGSYAPLSRPLYIYVNNAQVSAKPQVKKFLEYYVQWARNVAEDNNFVPVTETQRDDAKRALAEAEGS